MSNRVPAPYPAYDSSEETSEIRSPLNLFLKLIPEILGTPVVSVTIFQNGKSYLMSLPEAFPDEATKILTFLNYTVIKKGELLLTDTMEDLEYSTSYLVYDELPIRFCAGVPLVNEANQFIGVLLIMDYTPRAPSPEILKLMKSIAKYLSSLIEISFKSQILELKEMIQSQQEIIIRLDKMSLLGKMTAGISHEINNPLTAIIGKTEFLIDSLQHEKFDEALFKRELPNLLKNEMRINLIMKGVKTLYLNDAGMLPDRVSLAQLITEAADFCKTRLKDEKIEFGIDLEISTNLLITCQSTKLTQVILNLLDNSMDAISKLKEKWIAIHVVQIPGYVQLNIIDSGLGVEEKYHNLLMQSFFTTKDKGMGSGIGLNLSKRIIEEHHGKFYYNRDHPFTCFVIELPI